MSGGRKKDNKVNCLFETNERDGELSKSQLVPQLNLLREQCGFNYFCFCKKLSKNLSENVVQMEKLAIFHPAGLTSQRVSYIYVNVYKYGNDEVKLSQKSSNTG